MFISLSSTFVQKLSHSVAVAARTGIQLVAPQMIHFELFYHLVAGSSSTPKQNLRSLDS